MLHRPRSEAEERTGAWVYRRRETGIKPRQTQAWVAKRGTMETQQMRCVDRIAVPPASWVQQRAKQPQLPAPERRMTIREQRRTSLACQVRRPTGWTAPRVAACPTGATWFQRPTQRQEASGTKGATPAGKAGAGCAKELVSHASQQGHIGKRSRLADAVLVGRQPFGQPRCRILSVVLLTCTHGIVRLLHSRAHPGRLPSALPLNNRAIPGRRRWSCGQYP